jgi:hypothetical protein
LNTTVDVPNGNVADVVFPKRDSTTEKWDSIVNVGRIRLSEDEIARLPPSTAELYRQRDGYAGTLEVFHELHCLVSIPVGDW